MKCEKDGSASCFHVLRSGVGDIWLDETENEDYEALIELSPNMEKAVASTEYDAIMTLAGRLRTMAAELESLADKHR